MRSKEPPGLKGYQLCHPYHVVFKIHDLIKDEKDYLNIMPKIVTYGGILEIHFATVIYKN
jgi:hypothetical protein